ncbi:MAG: SGNH/GDSL hydrolase family protein [Lachnospiraceae bacterium]|nr:SGNH/GDSL hydrolase family protein [Lachnospiraceae bacterium]
MRRKLVYCFILFILCACTKSDAQVPNAAESETAEEIAASPTIAPEEPEEVVVLDMPGFEAGPEEAASEEFTIASAEPVHVDGIDVTDEMLKISVMREGNTERIKNVMRRAAKGEVITLGYLGGSITAGSNADPMETSCYAYLTTEWWKQTFPKADIRYGNAGIGATDSYIGVHRVDDDLLWAKPDLIVVEFSVNDSIPLNQESYDSLLLHLLKQENAPAVVPLIICSDDHCFVEQHLPVIESYDLPAISYYSLVFGGFVSWESVGHPDRIHPINPGHQLIAHILTNYYSQVLASISEEGPEYVIPDEHMTAARFENSDILYNDDIEPSSNEGFENADPENPILHGSGWVTHEAGSICFEADCRTLGIAYLEYKTAPEGGCAVMDVYVDDELVATLDPMKGKALRLVYENCLLTDEASHHVIRLKPSAESKNGKVFELVGLTVGY